MKSKFNLAVMIAVASALSRDPSEPLREAVKVLDSPLSEEDKNRLNGLKYFKMPDGTMMPAINERVALKKWNKRNNIK